MKIDALRPKIVATKKKNPLRLKFSHLSLSDRKMRIADLPKNQNKLLCHISSLNFPFGERVNARRIAKSFSLSNLSMCVLTEFSIFFSSAVTFYYVLREKKSLRCRPQSTHDTMLSCVKLPKITQHLHTCVAAYANVLIFQEIINRLLYQHSKAMSPIHAIRRRRRRRHHHDTHRKCNAQRLRKRNLIQISLRFFVWANNR